MRLPILCYHAVLPVRGSVRGTVGLDLFRRQVQWLSRRGFRAVGFDTALELLAGRGAPCRRPVLLTFDDGYRCVTEHALPVLEAAGFTATLFVVTGAVGRTTDWYTSKGGLPFEHASWDELAAARRRGFEIASHSVHHRPLADLSRAEVEEELGRSREEIRERLGACDHFAYPFGSHSPEVARAVARSGYRSAVTTRRGTNRGDADVFALRRQSVSRTTTLRRFRRRLGAWW